MTTLLGYVRTIISIQWSNFHFSKAIGVAALTMSTVTFSSADGPATWLL